MTIFTRDSHDIADVQACPEWIEQDTHVPAFTSADAAARYEMVDASAAHDEPALEAQWRGMLAAGHSPEKLYQTPAFFRYMQDAETAQPRSHALYLVRRRSDARVVAIVPVRHSRQEVAFGLGPLTLFRRTLASLQVLGSVPLLDRSEPGLAGFVMRSLLEREPACKVLSMQATPHAQLAALRELDALAARTLNGWRACHTLPLPETADAYLQKFSAKKRYNLARQVRLLAKEAGEVSLERVVDVDAVPGMIAAMNAVLPPAQFKALAQEARIARLAKHGLLLSYVVRAGGQPAAVIIGTRSCDVWHVHNICTAAAWHALSVGTSAVHLAVQDVIANFGFADADFGYGTPNSEFRSTQVLKERAHVLLAPARSPAALLLAAHGAWHRVECALAGKVKAWQRQREQRRRSAAAAAAAAVSTSASASASAAADA